MGALHVHMAILRHDVERFYEKHVIWKILRIIPRHVKYWVIIETATKGEQGNPSKVDALTMLDRLSKDYDEEWTYAARAAANLQAGYNQASRYGRMACDCIRPL